MRIATTRRPETKPARTPADRDPDTEAPESGPLRRCVVLRERRETCLMIRFVVGPGHTLVPDLTATLPGRGLWLSARRDVLDSALSKGAFAKAARGPVVVPPDLAALLTQGLERRIAELLGLARRAGQAVAGFERAREWTLGGKAALVVEASDGSPSERARFLGRRDEKDRRDGAGARHGFPGTVIKPLTAARLGTLFGRDHAVHVAVAAGRLAELMIAETARLAGVSGRTDVMERGAASPADGMEQANS